MDIPIQIVNGTRQIIIHVNDPQTEFIILLFATLIGTGIGVGSAIALDRKKKHNELNEQIVHIIDSITEELQDIIKLTAGEKIKLEELMTWNSEKRGFEGQRFTITTPAYESAIKSGGFILLPVELQSRISIVYNRIYDCQKSMNFLIKFYSTPVYVTNMANNLALNMRDNLINDIKNLKEEYETFLPYFKTNKNELLKSKKRMKNSSFK